MLNPDNKKIVELLVKEGYTHEEIISFASDFLIREGYIVL